MVSDALLAAIGIANPEDLVVILREVNARLLSPDLAAPHEPLHAVTETVAISGRKYRDPKLD